MSLVVRVARPPEVYPFQSPFGELTGLRPNVFVTSAPLATEFALRVLCDETVMTDGTRAPHSQGAVFASGQRLWYGVCEARKGAYIVTLQARAPLGTPVADLLQLSRDCALAVELHP